MKRIRVLIVEDSAVVREHLRRIISEDPRFEIAAAAASGEEALAIVERIAPDVITMDVQLPGMNGFDVTRQIMAIRPTPIVVVSGMKSPDVDLTMEALRAGALSVVEKPVATIDSAYKVIAGRLRTQLAIMSEVAVVRQRPHMAPKQQGSLSAIGGCVQGPAGGYRILAIAASTGGPNALLQLLNGLGSNFSLPIVVVQHITPGFTAGFGEWLTRVTPFAVSIVEDPVPLRSAHVYLADSNVHLVVHRDRVATESGPAVGGHRPSANVLYSSVARSFGSAAVAALLTGMGEDGAAGLREIREAGGYTIAEAESSAVVYGMPGAAVQAGAVCESRPIGEIAHRILELTAGRGASHV